MNNEISQEQELEISRRLASEKRQTILQRLREGVDKTKGAGEKVKEAQKTIERLKNIYRIINGATAITLVGLIITFLVMNAQLILGNLFKVKFVPALSLIEILILGTVDLVVFLALLILVVIIYFIVNPCELSAIVGTWWADSLGVVCKGAKEVIEAIK